MMSLFLNICLCVDLILTISDPFTPAKTRAKYYYMLSGTVSSLIVMFIYVFNKELDEFDCIDNQSSKSGFATVQNNANVLLAVTLSVYVVIAVYSLIYSIRRLTRPGVSVYVRNLFIKKHFFYVFVFIFIWMIQ